MDDGDGDDDDAAMVKFHSPKKAKRARKKQ
jgi:hypothetical protein